MSSETAEENAAYEIEAMLFHENHDVTDDEWNLCLRLAREGMRAAVPAGSVVVTADEQAAIREALFTQVHHAKVCRHSSCSQRDAVAALPSWAKGDARCAEHGGVGYCSPRCPSARADAQEGTT